MLIIVNPYATTVSDRLRHLVVYALRGPLRGRGGRYRGPGPRHRALPRGRARGLRRGRRVRRRRDRQRSGQRLDWPPHARTGNLPAACPGGSANVFGQDARHPRRARRRDRAPARDGRRLAPAQVDLGVVNGRCFTFASGVGLDASVVERVDANPRLKARLGPYYFAWAAIARSPAATWCTRREWSPASGGQSGPRASPRSCRTARPSPTSTTARSRSPRAPRLDSGTLAASVLHRVAPAGHAADRLARPLLPGARRPPPPRLELRRR